MKKPTKKVIKKAPAKQVAKKLSVTRKKVSPANPKGREATLPPQNNATMEAMFVARPDPLNSIYYNSDQAYQNDHSNSRRMWNDLQIYSAIMERQLATAELNFAIVPDDEEDQEQLAAAEEIEMIIKSTRDLQQMLRCLLDAIFWGRSGVMINYEYDFSTGLGNQRMVVKDWTAIGGDTLVFAADGRIGWKVGASLSTEVGETLVGVEGRFTFIEEEDREAWIVHNFTKQAGDYWDVRSAGRIFGVGLRDTLFPTWYIKQNLMASLIANCEKFASGYIVAYFEQGNPESQNAVRESMEKQIGSAIQLFPRSSGGEAAEGIEVINPPDGVTGMLEVMSYYDSQIRVAICGENLTADNKGGTGLGSNLADVHKDTFLSRVQFDAKGLQETLSHDFVAILQKYNGYEHLPPLKWEFAFDDSVDKLEKAKTLSEMGVGVADQELYQATGFTKPQSMETETDPNEMKAINQSIG